ncbi:calcium/calmodulin-dependent protein kinase [Metarhizium acridum CQMa 102]|uniref:non-specific serine/threonine protein kinase n=1 Tax=Metarhizium acridum (strain CQMa 102) TaxID=655827 RepID=E9EHF6_METAQ|nr:calcium/calmodulin-dependent protein kinase [Metarhizium acridum CQMa 102]EFY84639.1 calcium/calmodulin-dependent protein kinase [Metarhizium acridum CQMa 102]
MPRSPHPLALFSLVPANDRAAAVLLQPENSRLVSRFVDSNLHVEGYGLDIGLFIGSKSRYTLATIGRCGDIIVEGAGISRIQCSFEIHENNQREIMLQDRSTNKSTQFFGETARPFESGRTHRRVVLDEQVNLEFGFGGAACDLYRFRIAWHDRGKLMANLNIDYREDKPRLTRTVVDEPPTIAPSRRITRIHTPGDLERIRYSRREVLGSGAFGEVWKVANIDSGEYLAVKRVKRPALLSDDFVRLKREVETLSRISHRHIVEYRTAQWEDQHLEIFMEIKAGNVEDLVRGGVFITEPASASLLFHHLLQALDYLASLEIIHRDVKPENILYTPLPDGSRLYQLADFGLANIVADAQTFAGSGIYMAPELDNGPQWPQTPKMDVWSLFVTLTYAMNVGGFREKPLHTTALRIKAVQEAANEVIFQPLRDMAIEDPSQRATAGDMLDKLFAGVGRTTSRNRIHDAAAVCSPGPSPVQQETKWVNRVVEQRPPKEGAVARAKRRRPVHPVPGPTTRAVQRRVRQDEPRLPGSFPAA